MKRTLVTLTGLATLGVAAYLGSRLWAQAPPAAAPAPAAQPARPLQTRIGLVNLVQVLKDYRKFQAIEGPIKARSAELEKILEGYRKQLIDLKTEYGRAETAPARKDQIEKQSRELQMKAQMAEEDAKKELSKLQGDAAVQIYREVKAAVDRYALVNGYEAVFFYNDAITESDMYHPANVQRKMLQPACLMPMTFDPRMDISKPIVDLLNSQYPANAAGAPAGTPPAGH